MTMQDKKFVVCIGNTDYPAALELRKIYECLPDESAEKYSQLRVIDESGEDYLFPSKLFVPIELDESIQNAIIQAA